MRYLLFLKKIMGIHKRKIPLPINAIPHDHLGNRHPAPHDQIVTGREIQFFVIPRLDHGIQFWFWIASATPRNDSG
ncbi:MAG: hypothetical protein A2X77_05800 [Gammaproteobacteria bacterium GWE2_42_36]|nr:MAG: hypothetical protein A2X77_05800 [Gammaproteobacteria bacterium GWE2_42_36]